MFPGLTTRLSEETVASTTSIEVNRDLVLVTGTTDIATIIPHFVNKQFSGIVFLVPIDGDVALLTTGNIAVAVTCAQDRVTMLVFSKVEQNWKPGAIS